MSLILEALRKAEAERHAGKAPGLHAPTFPEDSSRPSRWSAARSGIALVAVLAVASAGMYFWRDGSVPASASASAPAPAPGPAAAPVSAPQPLPSAAPRQAAPQPSPVTARQDPPAPAPIAAAAPSSATLPSIDDLPADLRQALPALIVGGYIYADKPADRMVVLNQKLLREGDSIAPGLILERMLAREMILSFRGQRFRVAY